MASGLVEAVLEDMEGQVVPGTMPLPLVEEVEVVAMQAMEAVWASTAWVQAVLLELQGVCSTVVSHMALVVAVVAMAALELAASFGAITARIRTMLDQTAPLRSLLCPWLEC